MNADEIDNMQAGYKLNALIEETIFGNAVTWQRYINSEDDEQSEPWMPDWNGTSPNPVRCSPDDKGAFPNCRDYSTDIAAAWEVVERMIRIPKTLAEAEAMTNTRFFYALDRDALVCMSSAEAALYICKTALKQLRDEQR